MQVTFGAQGKSRVVGDMRHLEGDTVYAGVGSSSYSRDRYGSTYSAPGNGGYFSFTAASGAPVASLTNLMDTEGIAVRIIGGGNGTAQAFAPSWAIQPWVDFSLYPAADRYRRRITLSGYLRQVVMGVNSAFGFGYQFNPTAGALDGAGAGGAAGVLIGTDPAVSANWLIRLRATNAAPITIPAISTIPASQRIRASWIYTELENTATLEAQINGETLATFTPITAPQPAAYPTTAFGMIATYQGGRLAGGTADGDFRVRRLRFLIEELSGYD